MDLVASLLPDTLGTGGALLLVVASFFTSALTAAFGVGGGLFMLALMGVMIPVAALIPVHGAVQLGSNTGRAWRQRAHVNTTILLPFLAGAIVGSMAGGYFVTGIPDAALKLVLGIFIIVVTWARIPGFESLSRAGLAAGGGILGFVTMLVGATGPMMAAFLSKILPSDRKALVATHALLMMVLHALKIAVFGVLGFAFADWLPLVAAMIAVGYAGTLWGTTLLEKMPEALFRKAFRILLTLLALDLVRRGLLAWAG
ncbi:hypothetical protein CSC94_02550 [Zhengella mangrovi]|uniref:Probable membrane transporter protein n=1 Tax=Zhengella mangrovi TaxID=1982044 RepID=A0A2G1QTV2_9HYPH|nr:sulfite exporter TauE/SafE family protein [Zhengella mangrovi]PHP68889.1 hypothetical protein CSC94_02550 [Zhengella mangrovi]